MTECSSRVLVTGASGMLGRAVADALAAAGHDVTVLQRRSVGGSHREVLGDVRDPRVVAAGAEGQDAVVHLAAKVDVVGAWRDYLSVNVDGTRTLLLAARAAGATRFVHVSSPSVAYAGSSLVGAGAAPADPATARGHYARSKAIAERDALSYDAPGFAVVAVRPHLVWGPGDAQLVAGVVERARSGRVVLVGTGAPLIDTTYVDNAADAIVAALHRASVAHGQAVVVSNGEPRPLAEMVSRVCAAAGLHPSLVPVPKPVGYAAGALAEAVWALARPGSQPPVTRFLAEQLATAHWFDQRRTRELLAWAPAVPLEQGFARLAAWYAANRSG